MKKNQQKPFVSVPPEELSEEQVIQLQSDLIALAHDAIIIRNSDSRVIAWNKGAQALYGWSSEEASGQITHTLFQTTFPVPFEEVKRLLEEQGHWEGILTHISRDGSTRIVDSRQVIVEDQSSQTTAILEVNRDITMQVQLQQEQVQARVVELSLRETERQMNTFLSIISHELKTPLTSIKGNIQLARRQLARLLSQDTGHAATERDGLLSLQKFLERAERQINVQNRLVNDLIEVSRIQNNQLKLQREQCNLVDLVRQVVEEWRVFTSSRTIGWNCALTRVEVLADVDCVSQVVNNYLSNALRYSEVDTSVEVWLEQEDGAVRVSVRDQGPGLTLEQQDHIWERFFRLEEIETRSGSAVGLGLGLYICRSLIEILGGETGVTSQPGAGSTFWFTLPLASVDH